MAIEFDFYIHGLWIVGAVFAFLASMLAGNLEWVPGTTQISYAITVLLAIVMFLVAGMCWISAGANAKHHQK